MNNLAAQAKRTALVIDLESTNNVIVENHAAFIKGFDEFCEAQSAKRPHAIERIAAAHGYTVVYSEGDDAEGFNYRIAEKF